MDTATQTTTTDGKKSDFTEEVKARVPLTMKEQLDAIADARMLSMSDVVREALQVYLRGSVPTPEAKSEVAA